MRNEIEKIIEKLKERGFKITPQRLAIIRFLQGTTIHPTAEEIQQELSDNFPTMSLSTVYSTLRILEKIDEVQELSIRKDEKSSYDFKTNSHQHFYCKSCGNIIDIEAVLPKDCYVLEKAKDKGCLVEKFNVCLYGLCPACHEKEMESKG